MRLAGRNAVIRRLEIPHGRFIRQITFPGQGVRLTESRYANGCLEVRLAKTTSLG